MALGSNAWPHHARSYRPPDLLSDIRLLDLLELCGSTRQAGALLQLSQPTVSRRYRALAEDFGLVQTPTPPWRCRYGTTRTMQLLRLSCRSHRLEAGVARLGSDPLHAGLLDGLHWLLPTPAQFRALETWLALIREGVLDGALLSQLELDAKPHPDLSDLELHRLGALPLALAHDRGHTPTAPRTVLVPNAGMAPGLRAWLRQRGLTLRDAAANGKAPERWLQQLRGRNLAMLIGLAGRPDDHRLASLSRTVLEPAAESIVWLALPHASASEPLLQHTLERLRARLAPAG